MDNTPHQTIPDPALDQDSDHPIVPHHHHLHHAAPVTIQMHTARTYKRDPPSLSRQATSGDNLAAPTPTPTSTGTSLDTHTQPSQHKMLFSDLYKSPRSPLTKLRHVLPHPIPILPPGLDEDLISRDKIKQKEAVKRFLAERVRNDWEFNWPSPQPSPASVETASKPGTERSEAASSKSTPASSSLVETISNPGSCSNPAAVSAAPGPLLPNPAPDAEESTFNAGARQKPAPPEYFPRDSGDEADSESDTESVYSTVSEDAVHFRPRADWTSDLSDDEPQPAKPILSPFRFDSPDAVGAAVKSAVQARRARRRRELRHEISWNNGLACFTARRDAWTGARTVRVKPKATPIASPVSPISPRRLFWRSHSRTESSSSATAIAAGTVPLTAVVSAPTASSHPHPNALSPATTHASHQSTSPPSSEPDHHHHQPCTRQTFSSTADYPVQALIPLPPPLIPHQNPMRASITPSLYSSLYDKVVVHSLQPSCPINLSDMVGSCVAGWKRDGEWPPRSSAAVPAAAPTTPASGVVVVRRKKMKKSESETAAGHGRKGSTTTATPGTGRRMSFGFLAGRERKSDELVEKEKDGGAVKEDEGGAAAGKGIRRSLQKVFLGLGHHQNGHGGEEQQMSKEGAVVV